MNGNPIHLANTCDKFRMCQAPCQVERGLQKHQPRALYRHIFMEEDRQIYSGCRWTLVSVRRLRPGALEGRGCLVSPEGSMARGRGGVRLGRKGRVWPCRQRRLFRKRKCRGQRHRGSKSRGAFFSADPQLHLEIPHPEAG